MLQICFGTYLVLALPIIVVLWTALAASRIHDMEVGQDRQRFYRITLAISNFKNTRQRNEYDLLENTASL